MSKKIRISTYVYETIKQEIDQVIMSGRSFNMAEFLRDAVKDKLEKENLYQNFGKEEK